MIDMDQARRSSRPSPSSPAGDKHPGTVSDGNDGLRYEVTETANGVAKWTLTSSSKDFVRRCKQNPPVRVFLRPSLSRFDDDDEDEERAKRARRDTKFSFSSSRCMAIAWSAANTAVVFLGGQCFIQRVRWDSSSELYVIDYGTTLTDTSIIHDEMKSAFVDVAADTWMEGDIEVIAEHELHLDLVRVSLAVR